MPYVVKILIENLYNIPQYSHFNFIYNGDNNTVYITN